MRRKTTKWTIFTVALSLASCSSASHDAAHEAGGADPAPNGDVLETPPREPRVALVTFDGVRPEEAFGGAGPLPGLEALAAGGVALGRDEPFEASGPSYVSLPGYAELFTGVGPSRCADNDCAAAGAPTLVDRVARAYGDDQAAAIASWEPVGRVAAAPATGAFVSAGRSHPRRAPPDAGVAEALARGERSAAWPGHGTYRPDARTAEVALAYVRAHAPRLLVVSLGDTDEHAHAGDVAAYHAALRRADAFVLELTAIYRSKGDPFTVVVTSDHGRADNLRDHGGAFPESRRSWMVSGGTRPLALPAAPGGARLRDVAPAVLRALGLAP
ncbi:MAG: alkaline phosphatase family protein [Myxococcales bacterium]|nr:alkaline phosphatase family protein [Myxococcales bacterium]